MRTLSRALRNDGGKLGETAKAATVTLTVEGAEVGEG
jgi:hypothetical protein